MRFDGERNPRCVAEIGSGCWRERNVWEKRASVKSRIRRASGLLNPAARAVFCCWDRRIPAPDCLAIVYISFISAGTATSFRASVVMCVLARIAAILIFVLSLRSLDVNHRYIAFVACFICTSGKQRSHPHTRLSVASGNIQGSLRRPALREFCAKLAF